MSTKCSLSLKVRHKRVECIGCAYCVDVAPDYFYMDEEGLAHGVPQIVMQGKYQVFEGLECDYEALDMAARGCPVGIIEVE